MNSPQRLGVLYAEIDLEIRRVVWLLNELPGITTLQSCAGHAESDEAYVTFAAGDQDALSRVLDAMPFLDYQSVLTDRRIEWQCITLSVRLDDERRLVYDLRIKGSPLYVQRRALYAVEVGLLTATGQSRTLGSCSICASDRTPGTERNCPQTCSWDPRKTPCPFQSPSVPELSSSGT